MMNRRDFQQIWAAGLGEKIIDSAGITSQNNPPPRKKLINGSDRMAEKSTF